MIFKCRLEPVFIQQILVGLETILEKLILIFSQSRAKDFLAMNISSLSSLMPLASRANISYIKFFFWIKLKCERFKYIRVTWTS